MSRTTARLFIASIEMFVLNQHQYKTSVTTITSGRHCFMGKKNSVLCTDDEIEMLTAYRASQQEDKDFLISYALVRIANVARHATHQQQIPTADQSRL
jgi:hypothetical protein